MSTILVTGATGNVGTALLAELHKRGIRPKAAIHNKDNAAVVSAYADPVVFDFTDEQSMIDALQGVDEVFLLTPFQPDMVMLTENFLRAAKSANVKHIVKLSSIGADAKEPITMSKWHRDAELLIEASGIAYTHLRPCGFMQNFLGPIGDPVKRFDTLYLPIGDAKVSYVDVRDVASVAAVVLAPGHESTSYTITGPTALSGDEIAAILARVTGKAVRYEDPAWSVHEKD